mgnify:CR=1 FL=1
MRQSRLNLLVALFHTPRKYRDVPGQPMDEVGLDAAEVEAKMNAERVTEAQRTRERIEQATKKGRT